MLDYLKQYVFPNWDNDKVWLKDEPVGTVMFHDVWAMGLEKRMSPKHVRLAPPRQIKMKAQDRIGFAILTRPGGRRKGVLILREVEQFNSLDGLLDHLAPKVPRIPRASLRIIDGTVNYRCHIPAGFNMNWMDDMF